MVLTPVVADLHHFDEEQDPDPHWSEKLCPDLHLCDADLQLWFWGLDFFKEQQKKIIPNFFARFGGV